MCLFPTRIHVWQCVCPDWEWHWWGGWGGAWFLQLPSGCHVVHQTVGEPQIAGMAGNLRSTNVNLQGADRNELTPTYGSVSTTATNGIKWEATEHKKDWQAFDSRSCVSSVPTRSRKRGRLAVALRGNTDIKLAQKHKTNGKQRKKKPDYPGLREWIRAWWMFHWLKSQVYALLCREHDKSTRIKVEVQLCCASSNRLWWKHFSVTVGEAKSKWHQNVFVSASTLTSLLAVL